MLETAEKLILAYPGAKETYQKSGNLDMAMMFGALQGIDQRLAQAFAVHGQEEFVNTLVEATNLQHLKLILALFDLWQPKQAAQEEVKGFLGEVTKEDVGRAMREKKAIDIIKNYLKTFFAKRKVADIKQEDQIVMKQKIFKVSTTDTGFDENVYLKLTLCIHNINNKRVVTASIHEMVPLRSTVVKDIILPEQYTGDLEKVEDQDEYLTNLV